MNTFRVDPDNVILGSALRRATAHLLARSTLSYDPLRSAGTNDLVFGEIVEVPSRSFKEFKINSLERLYPCADGVKLCNEPMQPGPCIAVVGNRYAPPYIIGGLSNPITGRPNGEIKGGVVVDSLFGVNAVGFVNREIDPGERVRMKVKGVITHRDEQTVNLSSFRELLPETAEDLVPKAHWIVIAGRSTDAGKTTCAWALVNELRRRGFKVTVEKKTGTASCRDWLRCFSDPVGTVLENERDELSFNPDHFPARDFVDGLGIASDVSIGTEAFVSQSLNYTRAFLSRFQPDFHVIELADSISHVSNAGLLSSRYFRKQAMTFVYSGISTYEAAAHLMAFVRDLGHSHTPLILSGPLANENQFDMARDEIRERLGLSIYRSAIKESRRWIPEGSELANTVLARSGLDG